MGLLQNGYRHNLTCKMFVATTSLDGANPAVHNYRGHMAAANRNQLAGEGITDSKAAVPNGNLHSSAWIMPRKPGGMSARSCYIDVDTSASGLMGMPATGTSTLTISFAVTDGQLITSGNGSSTITISGNTSQLVASLSGAGSTTFAVTGVTSLLGALASGGGASEFLLSAVADILPLDDTSPARTASTSFSFTGELTPFATGTLEGEAFLAGGAIDEFAVLGRMEYDNAVHIDVTNGEPGTKFPIGTRANPVNNITDALTIARSLNLNDIVLLSDYTLESGDDVTKYRILSSDWKVLTVNSGAITTDTVFEQLSLYGELCGTWNVLIDCWTYNVTNFLGWVRGGSIELIELAPYINPDPFSLGSSYFDHIVPMYANIKSVIVMNDDVSVSITDCTDTVEIQSMTAGSVVNASLLGGKLIVDSTCVGGDIIIAGTGDYENNSLLSVNIAGLANAETVSIRLEDTIIPTNIKQINDVTIQGTGVITDKWRPV